MVPALVEMMMQVDERWDHLKAMQKSGFKAPTDQPDIDPPHEVLQLTELFPKLGRLPETNEWGKAFTAAAEVAERNAMTLEAPVRSLNERPTPETLK